MGLADFTITTQRSKVLDFSPTLGIAELSVVTQVETEKFLEIH